MLKLCRNVEMVLAVLASVLNFRLTEIIRKNNILKGLQYAGLKKSSVFELIRILTEIIQDANEENKELWILSQDMAKAYDRVNVLMLEKALKRIKVPSSAIRLIKNLFLNQKTEVITGVGNTDPYDVKVGIIQGEVLSPILWCIYYDPLLCEVQQRNLGYIIERPDTSAIETTDFEDIPIGVSGFMDDTQWISSEKDKLETTLYIADSFNHLNNIMVNLDKTRLLFKPIKKQRHQIDFNYDEEVEIRYGRNNIKIKPSKPKESIKILGCLFNVTNSNVGIKEKVKAEIEDIITLSFGKRVTEKIRIYIFNHVLIPRIEYWS